MIEVLVAATLVTMGVLGVFALLNKSLGTVKFVASEYIASNLAAEGIELVKSIIDQDSIDGNPFGSSFGTGTYELDYNDTALFPADGRPMLFNAASGLYSYDYDGGNPTPFVRRIEIRTDPDGNGCIEELEVRSIVEWAIRGGTFEVDVEDHFFDWRSQSPLVCP